MKKILSLAIMSLALFSCSKSNDEDNNKDAYHPEVIEVLKVLDGKWQGEGGASDEVLTFTLFGKQKWIEGTAGGAMWFHGNATREFVYIDNTPQKWDMYFNVDPKEKKIGMNEVASDGKYSIVTTKEYSYKIIDNNTIELHDKSLSWMHIYKYHRIR